MAGGFIDVKHEEAPLIGGTVDARSSFDGSGWTVSTGTSRATGGARTQTGPDFISGAPTRTVDPYGLSDASASPVMSAGYGSGAGSTLTVLAAGALVVAVVLGKKKG